MFIRALALLVLAGAASAASNLIDHDPDLTKTRALLVANQELTVAMTLADVEASRAVNTILEPKQLAHWKRLQSDMAESRPNEARRMSIFDYEKPLGLQAKQVAALKEQLVKLNTLLESSRKKITANQDEIRRLHPDLGISERGQLPRVDVLIQKAKEFDISTSQLNAIRPVAERLGALANETRLRIQANQQALQPLLAMEAPMDRVKPFVRSDAELITELSMAGYRASMGLHEKLTPKQREQWHIEEVRSLESGVRSR